jgi:hypothetical protein
MRNRRPCSLVPPPSSSAQSSACQDVDSAAVERDERPLPARGGHASQGRQDPCAQGVQARRQGCARPVHPACAAERAGSQRSRTARPAALSLLLGRAGGISRSCRSACSSSASLVFVRVPRVCSHAQHRPGRDGDCTRRVPAFTSSSSRRGDIARVPGEDGSSCRRAHLARCVLRSVDQRGHACTHNGVKHDRRYYTYRTRCNSIYSQYRANGHLRSALAQSRLSISASHCERSDITDVTSLHGPLVNTRAGAHAAASNEPAEPDKPVVHAHELERRRGQPDVDAVERELIARRRTRAAAHDGRQRPAFAADMEQRCARTRRAPAPARRGPRRRRTRWSRRRRRPSRPRRRSRVRGLRSRAGRPVRDVSAKPYRVSCTDLQK